MLFVLSTTPDSSVLFCQFLVGEVCIFVLLYIIFLGLFACILIVCSYSSSLYVMLMFACLVSFMVIFTAEDVLLICILYCDAGPGCY